MANFCQTYLGDVSPLLFNQLVNAVAISGSVEEVASRAGFSQRDILMIQATGGSAMELSKRFFSKWRLRLPTMRDVAVVMATDPPIFDAVDALRRFSPELLVGLEPELPDGEAFEHQVASIESAQFELPLQQQPPMYQPDSPDVTRIAGCEVGQPSLSSDAEPSEPPIAAGDNPPGGGPQQTSPPELVLKGLTAISFNADQIVSLPRRDAAQGVEVRGNFCRVKHLVVRLRPDGSAVQLNFARLQELRHPSLVCLMGARLQPCDDRRLSLDLFLPVYNRSLADALSDEASARRLTMRTRAGQLGSLMSALNYLHCRQPALVLPRKPVLRCELLHLDAFGRPIICWLDQLEECARLQAAPLTRDFEQLLDLAVELVSGRMRHVDEREFLRHRVDLLKEFFACDNVDHLLDFEDKNDFIDCRLVTEEDEDDEDLVLGAILRLAQRALRIIVQVANGNSAPGRNASLLERLAVYGA